MRLNNRLLPHELFFDGFLLLMACRLAVRGEFRLSLFYVLLLCVKAGLLFWNNRRPGRLSETFRLLFYPVAMNLVFAHLRWAGPAVHPLLEDARLYSVDQWLLGGQVGLMIEPWIRLPLTEIMTACYMVFFPYLIFSVTWYLMGPLERAKSFYGGWSVRSSSTFEDMAGAAFAGQHDTYLNVRGTAAITERVRDCFASLWEDRGRRRAIDGRPFSLL